jgi:Ca-activated chloride channel family protein
MFEWDPSQFHFLRPWWLLGLVLAGYVAWRLRKRTTASRWANVIDAELLKVLLVSGRGSTGRVVIGLTAVALAVAAIGLAGPTWNRLPQGVEQQSDAMVVVLDLSLSMYARDLEPSRLVRARHKISDLLARRNEGYTALVVFAGDAHIVAPLTDDKRTINNLLGSLSPSMMPVLGSNPKSAIEQARQLFSNAGSKQGRIMLITDGVDRITDVTEYSSRHFPISILGVGTADGAGIPLDFADRRGQFLEDDNGRPIMARLDEDRLNTIADLSHGRYATIGVVDDDISYLLATPMPEEDEMVEVDREFDAWEDVGYLAALIVLPFALGAFRRGIVLVLCVAALPTDANAGLWEDLWQRKDQQGYQALSEGQPESAAALFRDPSWRGVAEYRSGAYEAAEETFRSDGSPDGHYNRGNALAHEGRLEDAIKAYQQTLAVAPDHEDAAFNKALLEKLSAEQQQASEQDNQESQRDDSQSDSEASRDPNAPQPDQNEPNNQQDSAPQPDESSDTEQQTERQETESERSESQQLAESEASRDEKQEALEQWLRRVPDDPGGLLRRKFQHETNQRLRSGDYRSRQQEKIW